MDLAVVDLAVVDLAVVDLAVGVSIGGTFSELMRSLVQSGAPAKAVVPE